MHDFACFAVHADSQLDAGWFSTPQLGASLFSILIFGKTMGSNMIPCYLGIYILVQDIHIVTMALFSDFYLEIYILAQDITRLQN